MLLSFNRLLCIVAAFGVASCSSGQLQQVIHGSSSDLLKKVVTAFGDASIIPEVVDAFTPKHLLVANWTKLTSAQLGNSIQPSKLQQQPSTLGITSDSTSESGVSGPMLPQLRDERSSTMPRNLVIVITDPDAPSRQNREWSEVCHFIQYRRFSKSDSKMRAEDVMPYKPPGPPPKTGAHRYVLLAFTAANETIEELSLSKPADRQHWGYKGTRIGVRRWAKDNGLKPVAGNFFYSQNPEQ